MKKYLPILIFYTLSLLLVLVKADLILADMPLIITMNPAAPVPGQDLTISVTGCGNDAKTRVVIHQAAADNPMNDMATFGSVHDPVPMGTPAVLTFEAYRFTEGHIYWGDAECEQNTLVCRSEFWSSCRPASPSYRTEKFFDTSTPPEVGAGTPIPSTPPPPPPHCAPGAYIDGKCTKVDTAIGPINTDGAGIIYSTFSVLLSLSGAVALLIIIYSGYLLITSSGKPEQVQKGREMLTSALVGLLFIIFSYIILEVLTYDILRIPGFFPTTPNAPCPGPGPC